MAKKKRTLACRECDFSTSGPKGMRDHYLEHPDHAPPKWRARHGGGEKAVRRERQKRYRAKKKGAAGLPAPQVMNYCPNCGLDLKTLGEVMRIAGQHRGGGA